MLANNAAIEETPRQTSAAASPRPSLQHISDLRPLTLPALPDTPLVSIIMSNYNYERFIEPAVASVLSQTYPNWELVVCDDGSTDNSRSVLDRLAADDQRIIALYKENGGQATAWNRAYAGSNGQILCFLDSDDQFQPDKLRQVVNTFRANPDAGLLCHPVAPIDAKGEVIGEPIPRAIDTGWLAEQAYQRAGWGTWPPTSGVCIRREVADLLFPVPELLRFRRGGADNFISNAAQFLTNVTTCQPVGYYRVHGSNYIGSQAPTTQALTNGALDAEAITGAVATFIAGRFSPQLASNINLTNVAHYWEWLLGLFILEGKPRDGVQGYNVQELLDHLPESRRIHIWKMLLAAPSPVSKRLFRLWWGVGAWKRFARPITSRLGIG